MIPQASSSHIHHNIPHSAWYDLVFDGSLLCGLSVEDAKKKVATRFHFSEETVEHIFHNLPYAVKKHVDYKTAVKYQVMFESAGVLCQIEPRSQNAQQALHEGRQHCNVIFAGEIEPHLDVARVKKNLKTLLKLNDRRLDALFIGQPVCVMQDVDYHPALKIQVGFELAGAVCYLESVSPHPPQTESAAPQTPGEQAPSYPTMRCPKCGVEQKKARRCRQCGAYVSHYLKGTSQHPPSASKLRLQRLVELPQQEFFRWGIGLIVLGLFQFAVLGWWALALVLLGIANLLTPRLAFLVINGIVLCASGILDLVFMTVTSVLLDNRIGINAGLGTISNLVVLGGVFMISGVQLYLSLYAFRLFRRSRSPKSD